MKLIKSIVGIFIVLIVLVVVIITLFMGPIIKTSVETMGPKVTGVPITLENADFSLLEGEVNLKKLFVGNPEGFKTPSMFELNEFDIKIKVGSILSDTIEIEKIHIRDPEITFETSLKGNNIQALLEQMESDSPSKEEDDEEADEKSSESKEEEPGKKLIITDFLLEGAQVNLSMKILGGKVLTILLPAIHLTDIGKAGEGSSIKDIITLVLSAINESILKVVSAGDFLEKEVVGKGLENIADAVGVAGDAAKDIGSKVQEGASKLLGDVSGFLGKKEEAK